MAANGAAARTTHTLVEAEAAADFPRLGRIPSSTVQHFLDYYRGLADAEADELRAALAERGALTLRPTPGRAFPSSPAYDRWAQAKLASGFGPGARYQPLRLAKNIVSAGLAGESNLDAETAEGLAQTNAATAPQLRKLIKGAFAERLGLTGRNERGGNWTYGRDDGSLKVRIDFGGRSDQLRYAVTATDRESGRRIALATYETLLGLFGGWDWIVDGEAEHAVALLCELVAAIESVLQTLASH